MRTHAILTKYTSLRSFYSLGMQYSPMTYENAGGYTAILQEAYLDYKNLYKSVQLTAASVDAKKKTLAAAKVPQGSLESDRETFVTSTPSSIHRLTISQRDYLRR